jgi:type I restriction enzyme S subunit
MNLIELGKCCRLLSGGTPSKGKEDYWQGKIPWFSPKDIKTFDLLDSLDHITEDAIHSSATQLIPPNTVLVVGRSGVLARSLPVGITRKLAAFNQDIKAILPDNHLDPEYIALFLKSQEARVLQYGVKIGATVHSLKSGFLESLRIPLWNIAKQRQIAIHLKNQIACTEEAKKAIFIQLDEIKSIANAIITSSINQTGVTSYSIGKAIDEIKQGIGSHWNEYQVLGATREGLAPAKEHVGKNPERYKPVLPGTVFYNPMRILIGSIVMVDEDDPPGITSPDYVVLRGKEGLVDSRWFYYWLRSPVGERCIASLARGAVRERMLFNRLAEGEINLPPYSVQLAASQALAELRPLKHGIEARLRDIELLPARILANAFDLKEDSSHA